MALVENDAVFKFDKRSTNEGWKVEKELTQ